MLLHLHAERAIAAAPAAVFALALDPQRFAPLFRGCGPVPAIRRIEALDAPAVGARRALENSDGSRLQERITVYDPPRRHAYTLSGLRPPLAWLVRAGEADWHFSAVPEGTRVQWQYTFQVAHAAVRPLAWLLLRGFMRPAMQRYLAAMARALTDPAGAT